MQVSKLLSGLDTCVCAGVQVVEGDVAERKEVQRLSLHLFSFSVRMLFGASPRVLLRHIQDEDDGQSPQPQCRHQRPVAQDDLLRRSAGVLHVDQIEVTE